MKSLSGNVGNINLKGKLYKTLSCGCCDAQNLKQKELDKIHKREMQDAMKGPLAQLGEQ